MAAGDTRECEEAILKVTRHKGAVLQVCDRLSLSVQDSLYSLDDVAAMGQEELEKFELCLKRHLARTRPGWPLFRRKEGMKGQAFERTRQSLTRRRDGVEDHDFLPDLAGETNG